MADERNERTEYNWSYSGEDAGDYRSKYTQGFDPNYLKRDAERDQEKERPEQQRRTRTAETRPRRPSPRRARLAAQQEIRTERSGQEERPGAYEAGTDTYKAGSEAYEAGSDTYKAGSKAYRAEPKKSRVLPEEKEASPQQEAEEAPKSRGKRPRKAADIPPRRRQSAEENRTAGRTKGRKSRKGRGRRSVRPTVRPRQMSAAYRRRLLRRRYTILGLAAAAGIFLILFFANTYNLTITLSGDDPLYLELGETYRDPGATAVYKGSILHFGDTEVPVVSDHEINNRVCGTYEVTYHAEHKDQQATATRMVIIPDRTPPVLTLDESVNVVRKGDEWKDSFTAVDDQDGDITANVEVLGEVNMRRDGKYELTYRVQDSAGNEVTANRTVIVSSVAINRPETARQGDSNVIYLTFDDGPGIYTERLLDILDSHNVKATFFVTDTNSGSRDLIGEEFRRGHTIGVHTMTHVYDTIYESGQAFWEDIDQEIAIIKEQTGEDVKFMRFPGGSSNDLITTDDELRRFLATGLRDRGLKYFDWTIDSYDSDDEYTSDDVYWAMVDQTSVADPKMVLCHDLKRTSVDAIDNYLTWAIENHYVFLPITDETPEVHHIEF